MNKEFCYEVIAGSFCSAFVVFVLFILIVFFIRKPLKKILETQIDTDKKIIIFSILTIICILLFFYTMIEKFMFNDDEFFIDDDELAKDNQPNIVDEAIIKSLQTMQKITTELIDNIRFNEINDQASNLRLLSIHLDSITKLASIDTLNLSDEEISEEIEKVIKQTTLLDMKNIDKI